MDCTSNIGQYTPDGCRLDICAVTEDDMRCMVRSLLPPGEPWRKDAGRLVVEFADILAARAFEIVQSLCVLMRESDPCTAVDTIDQWAALYGVPPEVCNLALGCTNPGFLIPFKSKLVCIFERLQYGQPVTCCFFHDLGALFGVDVCCWPQPVTEDAAFCLHGGDDCETGKYPMMSAPALENVEADGRGCTGGGYEGMSVSDGAPCCLPSLPVYFRIKSTTPPVALKANCGEANDLLCRDIVTETVKCLIGFLLPAGVSACYIVETPPPQ